MSLPKFTLSRYCIYCGSPSLLATGRRYILHFLVQSFKETSGIVMCDENLHQSGIIYGGANFEHFANLIIRLTF